MPTSPPRLAGAVLYVIAWLGLLYAMPQAARAQLAESKVMGQVVEADSNDPLAGATVAAQVAGRLRGTITDADGRFELGLPQGAVTLTIRSLGYATAQQHVVVGDEPATRLHIALEPTALQINGVEVLATRDLDYERLPGTATRLDAAEIQLVQPVGTQELLEYVPGVYGASDDGMGNARLSIGIRGLNPRRSSRVLVLEDGIPIQPALYVYPNMYYNPPVERIERVEMIKGSAAIRYGPQTMGGVINYITSRPRKAFGGDAQLTMGANGYASAFAELGGFGTRNVVPEVQLLAKRGDGYRDHNAFSQANLTAKLNIRLDPQTTLFLKANGDYETYEATYTGLTEYSYTTDPAFNPKDDDRFTVRRASLDALYSRAMSPRLSSLTRAYVNVFDRRWWRENDVFIRPADLPAYAEDPSSVRFMSPYEPGDKVRVGNGRDNFGILRTFYVAGVERTYNWDHTLFGSGAMLEAGARLHSERFVDDRVLGDAPDARTGVYTMPDPDNPGEEVIARNAAAGVAAKAHTYETRALALYASERLQVGRLEVTPGARLEIFEQSRVDRLQGSQLDDKTTIVVLPGIGLNYDLGRTNLFGGVHRGFTPPSSGTLTVVDFGDAAEDGGLDVEAEKSWNLEAGARGELPWLAFEAAGFYLHIDDLVAAGRGTAFRNLGSARTFGAELTASIPASRYLPLPDVHAAYTWLQTEVLDGRIPSAVQNNVATVDIAGNELPYAPRHTLTVGLSRSFRDVTVRADVRHVSRVYTDFENLGFTTARGDTGPVPAYTLVGGSVQMPVLDRLMAQLTVKNALDEIYIGSRLHSNPRQVSANQSSGIIPGARRQVNLSLRYSF